MGEETSLGQWDTVSRVEPFFTPCALRSETFDCHTALGKASGAGSVVVNYFAAETLNSSLNRNKTDFADQFIKGGGGCLYRRRLFDCGRHHPGVTRALPEYKVLKLQ
ncbi:hypothetical protein chiPu_0007107 [Chiloscyllium punctatum]|uniref:Uncharacterized protein n=1 Tax=Chiloscyllium punctatum TaxID=137246 RepID=A0A401SE51_CHIPU|nr:hypothetical protein [Chiloscyllium punctatum]